MLRSNWRTRWSLSRHNSTTSRVKVSWSIRQWRAQTKHLLWSPLVWTWKRRWMAHSLCRYTYKKPLFWLIHSFHSSEMLYNSWILLI